MLWSECELHARESRRREWFFQGERSGSRGAAKGGTVVGHAPWRLSRRPRNGWTLRRPFERPFQRPTNVPHFCVDQLSEVWDVFNPLGAGVRKVVLGQPGTGPECHAEGFDLERGVDGGEWKAGSLWKGKEFGEFLSASLLACVAVILRMHPVLHKPPHLIWGQQPTEVYSKAAQTLPCVGSPWRFC